MITMFLDHCFDHDGCVIYSCEPDGWAVHLPDDELLLSRLNGSFDTFDRRNDTMLAAADYPSQAEAVTASPDAVPNRSWWRPWSH